MADIKTICGHNVDFDSLSNDSIIVDAGVSRGEFVKFIRKDARTSEARIYGLEPSSLNMKHLRNMKLGNTVLEHRALVGDHSPDKVKFYAKDNNPGWGNLYNMYGKPTSVYEVKVVRINSILRFFGIPRIDYLKMDIEGAEYEIIETMSPEIVTKINEISMEIHKHPKKGFKPNILVDILSTFGFKCRFTREDKHELWARKDDTI